MIKSQPRLTNPYQVWSRLVIVTITAIDLFDRYYPRWAIYGSFDDDFFYYAQVARNLAHGLGSTFDGIHATNGYHPLWLLCLTLFSMIDGGRLFFPLVTLTAVLSLVCIFILTVRCLSRLGVQPAGHYVVAVLITFWSDLLLRGGMEITLALPLILLLIHLWLDPRPRSVGYFFQLGLLSSLCILARLDSALFIALLFLATMRFEHQPMTVWLKPIFAFGCGMAPFWIYLAISKIFFGTLTPISSQAKQQRLHHTFELVPLISLVHPLTTVRLILVLPGILCVALLLIFLLGKQRKSSPTLSPVLWALALFPIVHIASLCVLSDWPLWYWYFYSLVLASLGAMAAWAARYSLPSRVWTGIAIGITLIISGYTLAYNVIRPARKNALFLAAQDIAGFADVHPGVYAMGDRSGTPGYLVSSPMIQLEGLMMDRAYLDRLRTQPPLDSVLREYGVNYYVSSEATLRDGCYRTREPFLAGPDSAHMLGIFCQQPAAIFTHEGVVTRIFTVDESPRRWINHPRNGPDGGDTIAGGER